MKNTALVWPLPRLVSHRTSRSQGPDWRPGPYIDGWGRLERTNWIEFQTTFLARQNDMIVARAARMSPGVGRRVEGGSSMGTRRRGRGWRKWCGRAGGGTGISAASWPRVHDFGAQGGREPFAALGFYFLRGFDGTA